MPESDCPTRDSLTDFLFGRLNVDDQIAMKEHLSLCPDCRLIASNSSQLQSARVQECKAEIETTVGLPIMSPDGKAIHPLGSDAPTNLGDYELLNEIARGGMGVVYRARQRSLNRIVALKMIRAGALADSEDIARFRTEAEAAAKLDHPGIVQVYEAGEYKGQKFLSMAFVDGVSLADKVGERPLRPTDAAKLICTIAEAIHYAHTNEVVHRDLKPSNILIDQNDRPRVTDFGLAKNLANEASLTVTGQVLGTPAFMPPEQATGSADVGPLSDVYSLGATLYYLLTGRPPFRAATLAETLHLVATADPIEPRQLNPNVPRDVNTICLKCLNKEPAQRYASAAALADDLRRYLDGYVILARPTSRLERAIRWARRNRLAAAVLVTLAVVATASTLYLNSRPAYLSVRVTPETAQLSIEGTPIKLTDGRATLEWKPGRYSLRAHASGHRPHREHVNLIRGRGNAAIVNVDLIALYGHLSVNSLPAGAEVKVFDLHGTLLDDGITPYFSPQISTGGCTIEITKAGYALRKVRGVIPDSGQVTRLADVELSLNLETQGMLRVERFAELMNRRVTGKLQFSGLSLQAALQNIATSANVPLGFDIPELRQADLASDVQLDLTGETLLQAFKLLLEPRKQDVRPVFKADRVSVIVTTKRRTESDMETILYNVTDENRAGFYRMVAGKPPTEFRSLKNMIWSIPGPWKAIDGRGGTLTILAEKESIAVTCTWRAHVEIFNLLQEIRSTNPRPSPVEILNKALGRTPP